MTTLPRDRHALTFHNRAYRGKICGHPLSQILWDAAFSEPFSCWSFRQRGPTENLGTPVFSLFTLRDLQPYGAILEYAYNAQAHG
jgi:hypothetical protein